MDLVCQLHLASEATGEGVGNGAQMLVRRYSMHARGMVLRRGGWGGEQRTKPRPPALFCIGTGAAY